MSIPYRARAFTTVALLVSACVTPGCGGTNLTTVDASAGTLSGGGASGTDASGAGSTLGGSTAASGAGNSTGGMNTGGEVGSGAAAGNVGSAAASGEVGSGAAAGAIGSGAAAGEVGSGAAAGEVGSGAAAGSVGSSGAAGGVGSGGAAGGVGSGGAAGSVGSGGSSGAAVCPVDNTTCVNGSGNGICSSQVCAACSDDSSCAAVYGTGNLCSSGACTPGDCRVSADCSSSLKGPICGAQQANFCGKCTSDSLCGAGNICDLASGSCVANSCSTGTGNACSQNSADVCCSATCFSGTCCDDTSCKTKLGTNAVCSNHTCTTCDAIAGANPVYLVDPASGNDGSATGSGTSGGGSIAPSCRFATITRALQAIGPSPAAGTLIKVVGASTVPTPGNANALAEAFPLTIPANVTVTAGNGAVWVKPPAGATAFVLHAPASGINGTLGGGSLTIDGSAHTANSAVSVTAGSTDTTVMRNVVVQNFKREGIAAAGTSILSIFEGVSVTGNGFGSNSPGLRISVNAHVNITVPQGGATTSFNQNAQHGILVSGNGSLSLSGVQSGGTGTIECRQNAVSGLSIAQTAGAPPQNSVNGLLVVGTTGGNGIRLAAGSNVTLINSYSLGNFSSGVLVTTTVTGKTRNNDISNIILGTDAVPGGNTFQADLGSNANQSAGICVQLDPNSGSVLARGNKFSKSADCANAAAVLSFSNKSCGGNRDLGVTPQQGSSNGNDIDVAKCSHL